MYNSATPWTHGSSVHGIFQAGILEWFAISFSRGSSQPRDRTQVSCIAGRHFTVWASKRNAQTKEEQSRNKSTLIKKGSVPYQGTVAVIQSLSRVSLQPHELQHARLLCPLLSPGVCSNWSPLSCWVVHDWATSLLVSNCLNLPFGNERRSRRLKTFSYTQEKAKTESICTWRGLLLGFSRKHWSYQTSITTSIISLALVLYRSQRLRSTVSQT